MAPIDVLVAGAGPVGLTLAHELARRGVRVRLVDAADAPASTSRAIATHARTLEVLDQMGLADGLIGLGNRIEAFTLYQSGRRLARLGTDYRPNPTRFPFTVGVEQVRTEQVLRGALESLGVTVEWGTRLAGFSQDDSGVRVSLTRDGQTDEVTVPWLVGCDGGHSTVRKGLGLPLIGSVSETWLLADATVTVSLPRDSIYLVRTNGKNLMLVPLPGPDAWRVIDTADVSYDGDGRALADRLAAGLSRGLGEPVTMGDPSWVSVFTAQQRMVPAMQDGRVLVAGDAAHVHSPASGQGMNTGIQEAFNLGWKLAMVVNGQATPGLLDSYSAERVPVGRRLLGSTGRATVLVALKNTLAGWTQPAFFAVVRAVTPLRIKLQQSILAGISGLTIGYPDSPLTSSPGEGRAAGPAPGERLTRVAQPQADTPGWRSLCAALREPGWLLLAAVGGSAGADEVAGWAADRYRDWLAVHAIGAADPDAHQVAKPGEVRPLADPDGQLRRDLAVPPGGWLLVRPDGYLAARGAALTTAELARALAPAHLVDPVPAASPGPVSTG